MKITELKHSSAILPAVHKRYKKPLSQSFRNSVVSECLPAFSLQVMQALYQLSAGAPQAFQSPGQPPVSVAAMKQLMQTGVSPVFLQQLQVAQQQQLAAVSAGDRLVFFLCLKTSQKIEVRFFKFSVHRQLTVESRFDAACYHEKNFMQEKLVATCNFSLKAISSS